MSKSMRIYSPENLFQLIKSDEDVVKYVSLYKNRDRLNFLIIGSFICMEMIRLLYLYIQSTYFPVPIDTNIPFKYDYLGIMLDFSIPPAIVIGLYFVCKYDSLLHALKPIAKTSRCLDINELLLAYSATRTIRDDVLKQGRQLYNFDADYMEDTVHGSESDDKQEAIEVACKNIYNIERNT